ncbi:MAG: hypothetical protein KDB79_04715 [Acidobacteria bacterium]|nr:hypothetical protein [Acidobacteriota bacterium]
MNSARELLQRKRGIGLTIELFALFRKTFQDEKIRTEKLKEDESDYRIIRCPKCAWQPSASSIWYCSDCLEPEYYLEGCGTSWNTFDTHGKCPGCNHIWRWTSCLSCSRWSLHDDWYQGIK